MSGKELNDSLSTEQNSSSLQADLLPLSNHKNCIVILHMFIVILHMFMELLELINIKAITLVKSAGLHQYMINAREMTQRT